MTPDEGVPCYLVEDVAIHRLDICLLGHVPGQYRKEGVGCIKETNTDTGIET